MPIEIHQELRRDEVPADLLRVAVEWKHEMLAREALRIAVAHLRGSSDIGDLANWPVAEKLLGFAKIELGQKLGDDKTDKLVQASRDYVATLDEHKVRALTLRWSDRPHNHSLDAARKNASEFVRISLQHFAAIEVGE